MFRVMLTLLWLVGVSAVVGGAVMIVRGVAGRAQISRELTDQRIVFPPAESLSPPLSRHAGATVRTGEQARAFADVIAENLTRATGGRTYAEIGDELVENGGGDERLKRLQQTAFTGQMLRGSLLAAYQAAQVTWLVIGVGGLFLAVGLGFVGLAISWD